MHLLLFCKRRAACRCLAPTCSIRLHQMLVFSFRFLSCGLQIILLYCHSLAFVWCGYLLTKMIKRSRQEDYASEENA